MTSVESYHPFRSPEAKERYLAHYNDREKDWPVAFESFYVETSFGQTFVRKSGSSGPPLLLLAGDSETSLAWIPPLKEGLASSCTCFAIDHIYDNGKSIYTRPLTSPDDYVTWLDELITALLTPGEQNINIMAHSYGGWQAVLYASKHPDRVHKLMLLAPNGALRPRLKLLPRAIFYWYFPTKSVVRRYLYWYAPVAAKNNRQELDELVEDIVLSFQCFKRRKFVPPTLLTQEQWNVLEKQVPTMLLVGDQEVTYSADRAIQHLAAVAPDITTMMVADADHHLSLVQPHVITTTAQEFFMSTEQ